MEKNCIIKIVKGSNSWEKKWRVPSSRHDDGRKKWNWAYIQSKILTS